MDDIYTVTESRMQKTIDIFKTELAKIRTGRAHPGILENLKVSYYGNDSPLKQIASITTSDARTLVVTPWDKTAVSAVEKAILQADLGLNPITAGQVIRIPLPPMTEERRKDLVKVIRGNTESTRIAIRNIRRDAITQVKELLKEKQIGEDEQHRREEQIQKLTDKYIGEVDHLLTEKEQDIMAI